MKRKKPDRKYTREFKVEAVPMSEEHDRPVMRLTWPGALGPMRAVPSGTSGAASMLQKRHPLPEQPLN